MIKTLVILVILAWLVVFGLVLALISTLDDLCEYEKKIKSARTYMTRWWISYEDITPTNEKEELEIQLQDIKDLYEMLGEVGVDKE